MEPTETMDAENQPKGSNSVKESEPIAFPPILLEGDEPPKKPEPASSQETRPSESAPDTGSQAEALPETYGTGRLILAARDPRCLYAHWDFSADQQKAHRNLSEQARLQLRGYKNLVGGPLVSEELVHPETSYAFVRVGASSGKYVAEMGYYPPGGAWKPIARSDPAVAPMEEMTTEQPVRFATLTFAPDRAVKPAESTANREHSAAPFGLPTPIVQTEPEFPLARSPRKAVAPEPIGFGVQQEPKSPIVVGADEEFGSPTDTPETFLNRDVMDLEAMTAQDWMRPALAPEGDWTDDQKRELQQLSGWSLAERRQIGSGEIEELIRGEVREGEARPAEWGPPSAKPGEEISISSLGLAGPPPEQRGGFCFGVNAELVIYGATEPDAAVTIGGRRIRLRPDGTFSYRFSLPDGSYHLPLAARSAQGEERVAELSFNRGTKYGGEVKVLPQNSELKAPTVENVD